MNIYIRAVVEKYGDFWIAWFRDQPETVCDSDTACLAILFRVSRFSPVDFDEEDFLWDTGTTPENRFEVLIPWNHRISIPTPSVN